MHYRAKIGDCKIDSNFTRAFIKQKQSLKSFRVEATWYIDDVEDRRAIMPL